MKEASTPKEIRGNPFDPRGSAKRLRDAIRDSNRGTPHDPTGGGVDDAQRAVDAARGDSSADDIRRGAEIAVDVAKAAGRGAMSAGRFLRDRLRTLLRGARP